MVILGDNSTKCKQNIGGNISYSDKRPMIPNKQKRQAIPILKTIFYLFIHRGEYKRIDK